MFCLINYDLHGSRVEVHSADSPELLEVASFKLGVRQNNSFVCFVHCEEFSCSNFFVFSSIRFQFRFFKDHPETFIGANFQQ